MRITKVYTRIGDGGKTRLAGGKDSHRVEAYGTLDELSAVVGVVGVMNAEVAGSHAQAEQRQEFKNMPQVTGNDVTNLEKIIDRCQKDLAPLKELFCLAGERCRDFYIRRGQCAAERSGYACIFRGKSRSMRCKSSFVNRLSDALFVLARWAAKTQGEPEFLWERDVKKAAG